MERPVRDAPPGAGEKDGPGRQHVIGYAIKIVSGPGNALTVDEKSIVVTFLESEMLITEPASGSSLIAKKMAAISRFLGAGISVTRGSPGWPDLSTLVDEYLDSLTQTEECLLRPRGN